MIAVLSQVVAAVQSAAPSPTSPEPLWLAAGGIVGAFARAYFIKHQATMSRETGFDVFLGFLVGLLWNVPLLGVWPLFDFAPQASYLQRAAIVAIVALVAVEIVKRALIAWAPAFLEQRLGAILPKPAEPETPK